MACGVVFFALLNVLGTWHWSFGPLGLRLLERNETSTRRHKTIARMLEKRKREDSGGGDGPSVCCC